MSAGKSDYDIWMFVLLNFMRTVHTIKPAVVTAVNGAKLNCRITTKTRFSAQREEIDQPDCIDIPYFLLSARRGDAVISMPIAIGDPVVVLFSDRAFGDLLETDATEPITNPSVSTHGYNPVLALPSFLTATDVLEDYSGDIAIKNGNSLVRIASDGVITATGSTFNFGDGSDNLFDLLRQLSAQVNSLSTALAGHVHSSSGAGTPTNAATFTTIASTVNTITTKVNNLS